MLITADTVTGTFGQVPVYKNSRHRADLQWTGCGLESTSSNCRRSQVELAFPGSPERRQPLIRQVMMVHQIVIISDQSASVIDTCACKQTTGALIKVFTECCPLSTDRVVEISGDGEKVANTVYAVFELLQSVCCCLL